METAAKDIAEQARRYSKRIGTGAPPDVIADIAEFAKDVTPRDFYNKHSDIPFWYVRQEKVGHEDAVEVGKVADLWVEDANNVQRAAEQVKRPVKAADRSLVRAFGIYRFKPLSNEEWTRRAPLNMDDKEQTLVCLALEDLSSDNGFFIALHRGQDICIDGHERVLVPPTGGGLAVLFWIDL